MPEKDSVQIFYMDDDDRIVDKAQATQVRILEYKDGERFETYGVLTPNNQQEVEK